MTLQTKQVAQELALVDLQDQTERTKNMETYDIIIPPNRALLQEVKAAQEVLQMAHEMILQVAQEVVALVVALLDITADQEVRQEVVIQEALEAQVVLEVQAVLEVRVVQAVMGAPPEEEILGGTLMVLPFRKTKIYRPRTET